MIYIKKHDNLKDRIVGKIDGDKLESDDQMLIRIVEEVWGLPQIKKEGNKKLPGTKLDLLKARLYNPYFLSENENPEFELYKYETDLKKLKEAYSG